MSHRQGGRLVSVSSGRNIGTGCVLLFRRAQSSSRSPLRRATIAAAAAAAVSPKGNEERVLPRGWSGLRGISLEVGVAHRFAAGRADDRCAPSARRRWFRRHAARPLPPCSTLRPLRSRHGPVLVVLFHGWPRDELGQTCRTALVDTSDDFGSGLAK